MSKVIPAEVVVAQLQAGKTDFRDLGVCEVIGNLPWQRTIEVDSAIYLGSLIFKEPTCFGNLNLRSSLYFGNTIFESDFSFGIIKLCEAAIYFESATFEKRLDFDGNEFDCSIHLGSINVLGEFKCIGALSGEPWIYADQRPDVAWVMQQSIQANIQYQTRDAPPWMQPNNVMSPEG